jgi:hypothetical protein
MSTAPAFLRLTASALRSLASVASASWTVAGLEVDDEGAEAVDARRKEGRDDEARGKEERREDAMARGDREVPVRRGAGNANAMLPVRGEMGKECKRNE